MKVHHSRRAHAQHHDRAGTIVLLASLAMLTSVTMLLFMLTKSTNLL